MSRLPLLWLVLAGCGNENKLDDDLDPGATTADTDTDTTTGPAPDTDADTDSDSDTDTDTDADSDGPPTGGTDTGTWTDTGSWGACEWAAHVAGYLDQFQTPGDGLVWYCHNDGGPDTVFQESNVDSCLTHIAHSGDIFPTTICDS
jgi:hypothetical protein